MLIFSLEWKVKELEEHFSWFWLVKPRWNKADWKQLKMRKRLLLGKGNETQEGLRGRSWKRRNSMFSLREYTRWRLSASQRVVTSVVSCAPENREGSSQVPAGGRQESCCHFRWVGRIVLGCLLPPSCRSLCSPGVWVRGRLQILPTSCAHLMTS